MLAQELNLDRDVISLLQQLPYVTGSYGQVETNWGDNDFVLRGEFVDFRKDVCLSGSRDPFYTGVYPHNKSIGWDDEDGQYMQPWYQPLTQLGNHGVVLILNMRNRKLEVISANPRSSVRLPEG